MNLAPDAVTLNFQEITLVIPDAKAMLDFQSSIDLAITRYKLILEGTPYYTEIFEDAAYGLCSEIESLFSKTFRTNGLCFIVQLCHKTDGHYVYVSLLVPSVYNCKRHLFKYLH